MKTKWANGIPKQSSQCWLLSGLETLLIEETYIAITKKAKSENFNDCHRLNSDEGFTQGQINQITQDRGLFGDGILLEIRLPNGKTGINIAKLMDELVEKIPDYCFLIVIASNSTGLSKTAWCKKFEKKGIHIEHPTLYANERKSWLNNRLDKAEISIDSKGKELLLDTTEGNLLALEQEVMQLEMEGIKLMTSKNLIVRLSDQAKFNMFSLPEAALSGQASKALRMSRLLKSEGVSIVPLVWSLTKDLRLTLQLCQAKLLGIDSSSFFKTKNIWYDKQKQLLATSNLGLIKIQGLFKELQLIDKQSKGQMEGDGWLSLEKFIVELNRN